MADSHGEWTARAYESGRRDGERIGLPKYRWIAFAGGFLGALALMVNLFLMAGFCR